jgi:hypothetical protein
MSDALPQPEPPRDLKWGVLVGFAAATPKLPDLKDKSSPLNAVANNFLRNIQRINWMILAPSLVGDLTINIQRCFDLAEITLTGTMNTTIMAGLIVFGAGIGAERRQLLLRHWLETPTASFGGYHEERSVASR